MLIRKKEFATVKTASFHDTNFVVTVDTAGCHNDNLRYHPWRQSGIMTCWDRPISPIRFIYGYFNEMHIYIYIYTVFQGRADIDIYGLTFIYEQ